MAVEGGLFIFFPGPQSAALIGLIIQYLVVKTKEKRHNYDNLRNRMENFFA